MDGFRVLLDLRKGNGLGAAGLCILTPLSFPSLWKADQGFQGQFAKLTPPIPWDHGAPAHFPILQASWPYSGMPQNFLQQGNAGFQPNKAFYPTGTAPHVSFARQGCGFYVGQARVLVRNLWVASNPFLQGTKLGSLGPEGSGKAGQPMEGLPWVVSLTAKRNSDSRFYCFP